MELRPARFDTEGTRLLCRGINDEGSHHVVLHQVPSEQQNPDQQVEPTILKSPSGYSVPMEGRNICCFAGEEDQLVVAQSATDHSLHFWSVPNGMQTGTVDHLLSLRGHQEPVNCVRFCKAISSLVSCSVDGVIKL